MSFDLEEVELKNFAIAAALTACLSHPASAQVANNPEIVSKLQALGSELSREMVGGTMQIYGPLHAQADHAAMRVASDVAYGAHDLQKLDVYAPAQADAPMPVVVFVHGGGFVRGDKTDPDAVGVGPWFAKNGVVGVTINYRLAPEISWPAGAQDLGSALGWVKDHISEYGGDPSKIVIAGHSAGSIHVADYTFREDLQNADDGVIGAVIVSPPLVDLTARELDPTRDALYYGAEGDRAAQSVISALDGRKIPVLVAYAQNEPDLIIDQTRILIDRLTARDGRLPLIVGVPGHNHISVLAHIGTDDASLAQEMLDFVKYQSLTAE